MVDEAEEPFLGNVLATGFARVHRHRAAEQPFTGGAVPASALDGAVHSRPKIAQDSRPAVGRCRDGQLDQPFHIQGPRERRGGAEHGAKGDAQDERTGRDREAGSCNGFVRRTTGRLARPLAEGVSVSYM